MQYIASVNQFTINQFDISNFSIYFSAVQHKISNQIANTISAGKLWEFYCRITKAEDAMKLSTFKEYMNMKQSLCEQAKTRLLDFFKAGRGACMK